ncbi:MAG TPA: protocatechuate 3,4-dioxygenase subunit beta [Candidatus Binataceae bacterium]|nr:protocatechuate 3,4-dioxygenase subunit beta [Candidatus Binataceae bacterium]
MNAGERYRRLTESEGPRLLSPAYGSTQKRAPLHAPILIDQTLSEITGPRFGLKQGFASDSDMTRFDGGEALGERIVVSGRVLDEDGRAIPECLIEIWQANAAGRYAHEVDQHSAPLDPHFNGVGRTITDAAGVYRFVTIKPGAYPWRNHYNAWRPAHIHYSLFGPAFATRLVTQMYFEGDPLLALDPIFNSIEEPAVRNRLIAALDMGTTVPEHALGYRFDFVLRGRLATPAER